MTSKIKAPTEKAIEKDILAFLRMKGAWCTKVQSGSAFLSYTTKTGEEHSRRILMADYGTPDIIGVINGHFFAIEVKRNEYLVRRWHTGKDARARAQKEALLSIQDRGGHAFIVYSLDDCQTQLEEEGLFTKK